jgi:hypothetical protein
VGLLTGRPFGDALGSDHSLAGLWRCWDVLWYISVAGHGYVWQPLPRQSNLAFFPQYMLWLFPLVAYVEGLRLRWVVLAVLTVAIYPNAYGFHASLVTLPDQPAFMATILARNTVLLVLTAVHLGMHVERSGPATVAEWTGRPGPRRVDG